MKKFLAWAVPSLIGVYILTYIILTVNGEYKASIFQAKSVWHPMGLELKKTDDEVKGNVGGMIFMPMILIDRTVWHRDAGVLQGVKDDLKESLDD